MPYYDHVCKTCEIVIEDTNPSPPLCPVGHGLMSRKFTPLGVIVKGGTPKFYNNKAAEKKAKWQEARSEQIHQDKQEDAELARLDKEIERDYIGGELSYKHGHGSFEDERQTVKEDEAKGFSHGPKEVQ